MYKIDADGERWREVRMLEFLAQEAHESAKVYNLNKDNPNLAAMTKGAILSAVNKFLDGNSLEEIRLQILEEDLDDEIEDIEDIEKRQPKPYPRPDRFDFDLSEEARELELEQSGREPWEQEYMQLGCNPDYA